LGNPDSQKELLADGGQERGEGSGEARPWIIPLSSSAEIGDGVVDIQSPVPSPLPPSEAERMLRKNINNAVTAFLSRGIRKQAGP